MALWLGCSWEQSECLPGHAHRPTRIVISKGEDNERNIKCVDYKESMCLSCGFSVS